MSSHIDIKKSRLVKIVINTTHESTLPYGEQVRGDLWASGNSQASKPRTLLFKGMICLEGNYVYYFATMPSLQTLQTLIALCVFHGDSHLPGSLTDTLPVTTSILWQYCRQIWCDDGIVSHAKFFLAFLPNLSKKLQENIGNKGLDSML